MNELSQQLPDFEESIAGIKRLSNEHFAGTLPQEIVDAAKDNRVAFVYQRGVGYLAGEQIDSGSRYLETSDFSGMRPGLGSCVAVVLRSPESNDTLLAHVDSLTDLGSLMAMVEEKFQNKQLDLCLAGGRTGSSELTVKHLVDLLRQRGNYTQVKYDLFGEQQRQVVVDGATGMVYVLYSEAKTNLKSWDFYPPDETKWRQGQLNSAEPKLFIDFNRSMGEDKGNAKNS